MTGPFSALRQIGLALAVCSCCGVHPLGAQQTEPLSYRRLLIPANELSDQIRGLVPMKREEFDRRIASSLDPAAPASTRIEHATFRAVLEGEALKDGDADLSVIALADQSNFLALAPLSVAIGSANWESPDLERKKRKPAVVGRDGAGQLRCLVPKTGRLKLGWSQPAARSTTQATIFDLQFPPAAVRHLEIDAPHEVELTLAGGLLVEMPREAEKQNRRSWIFALSGRTDFQLLARPRADARVAPQVVVSEDSTYSVLPGVLDVQSTLTIHVLEQSLEQLKIQVDAGLEVTSVRMAEQDLPLEVDTLRSGEKEVVSVRLPGGLAGPGHVLEVESTARWSPREAAALPRLRLSGATFQEGRLEINAPAWLRLQPRPISGCLAIEASSAAGGRLHDRFVYQVLEAEARLILASNTARSALREESGVQISIEPHQMTAVLVAELTALGNDSRFEIDGLIPSQWIVDSVETQPADRLADRSLVSRGTLPQALHLKLAHALTAQQPLRVVIRAHAKRPANDRVVGEEVFHVAAFFGVKDRRQLLAWRVNDSSAELQLTTDANVPRLDPALLPLADRRLFEAPPGNLLVEARSAEKNLRAELKAASPRYRADVVVRADVQPGRIEENLLIHCQPESSSVASVVVRLAPRPLGEPTWRLLDDETGELPAVIESLPSSGAASDELLVRLLLPRPTSDDFSISGHWSSVLAAPAEIPLVYLPSATRQAGLVEITAPGGGIYMRAAEVQPVPAPHNSGGAATMLGRFRYEAGKRNQVVVEPLPSGVVARRAWIEALQLESRFLPDGTGQHEATFQVRSAGAEGFRLRLPAGALEGRRILHDGQPQMLDTAVSRDGVLIPLLSEEPVTRVFIRYASRPPKLGAWPLGMLRAPIPVVDIPMIARTWRVLLPPGMEAMADSISPHNRSPDRTQRTALPAPHSTVTFFEQIAGPELALARRAPPPVIETEFAGWSELDLELPLSDEASLSVVRKATIAAWSLCLVLAAAAIALLLSRRMGGVPLLAAMVAAIALCSPWPWALLVGSVCGGLLMGELLMTFRAPPARQSTPHTDQSRSTIRRAAPLLLMVWISLGARSLMGAPPEAGADSRLPRPRVVFPVDGHQQPFGDYVYVEHELYAELHRAGAAKSGEFPAWLLQSARYDVKSGPRVSANDAVLDELRIDLNIHTFGPATRVHLPLRREQILLLPDQARLDGSPVVLAWDAHGLGLSADVPQAGSHALTIACAAIPQKTAQHIALDIDVPPAASATVNLPPRANARLVGDPARGKLAIQWPMASDTNSSSEAMQADQLLLWKIRRGSVSLESRWRLRSLAGAVRELTLHVDPRLRLLPARTAGPVASLKPVDATGTRWMLELAQGLSGETEIRLAWLWADTTGMGTLRLPQIQLDDVERSHDWTVLAADAGLEVSPPPAAPTAQQLAELTRIWPDLQGVQIGLLRATGPTPGSALFVRPQQSPPRTVEATNYSVSHRSAHVEFSARLSAVSSGNYEYRLAVPAGFVISRMTLEQASRPAAIRWSQQSAETVIVSLLDEPQPEQLLTVAGTVELRGDASQWKLSPLSLLDATCEESLLRVFRHSDVQIEVDGPPGWVPVESDRIGQFRRDTGRLVAALRRQIADAPPLTMARAVNEPTVSGKMLIRAAKADGDWRCDVALHLAIGGGVLDELRLAIPEQWSGPFQIDLPVEERLEASPREARRQLVLRPLRPLSGDVEISLRAPIHAAAGGLQAPDVALVGQRDVERFVLLDRGSPHEPIDWKITGLLPISLEAEPMLPAAWQHQAADIFRVAGPRFEAAAQMHPAVVGATRVPLIELHAQALSGGRLVLTASLTCRPAGAREAIFTLPPGNRLISALTDELPAACICSGIRTWKLNVPSDVLPYRLTLIYEASLPTGPLGHTARIAPPELRGMDVDQCLWTIDGLGANSETARIAFRKSNGSPQVPVGAREAHLARLQAAVQALEAVADAQSASLPPALLADSFLFWKQLFTRLEHDLAMDGSRETMSSGQLAQESAAADAASRAEQRLLQAGVLDESQTGDTANPFSSERSASDQPDASATYFLLDADTAELRLEATPQKRATDYRPELVAACALLVAFLLRASAVNNRSWLPPLTLGVAGAAWWLLAPLGWLGGLAILTAVIGLVRLGFVVRRGLQSRPAISSSAAESSA